MGAEPDHEFKLTRQALVRLADALGQAGADSLQGAFPAVLLAATWRALLENGVIEAPTRVDVERVEVLVTGPDALELRVPMRTKTAELIKAVPVVVEWTATGDLTNQLGEEAEHLVDALELAASLPTFEHTRGPGQKPHN
jgi:hypothetical protein